MRGAWLDTAANALPWQSSSLALQVSSSRSPGITSPEEKREVLRGMEGGGGQRAHEREREGGRDGGRERRGERMTYLECGHSISRLLARLEGRGEGLEGGSSPKFSTLRAPRRDLTGSMAFLLLLAGDFFIVGCCKRMAGPGGEVASRPGGGREGGRERQRERGREGVVEQGENGDGEWWCVVEVRKEGRKEGGGSVWSKDGPRTKDRKEEGVCARSLRVALSGGGFLFGGLLGGGMVSEPDCSVRPSLRCFCCCGSSLSMRASAGPAKWWWYAQKAWRTFRLATASASESPF